MKRILYTLMALALVLGMTFAVAAPSLASEITLAKNVYMPASAAYYVGETIYYEMSVRNPNTNTATNTLTRIWDTLPNGTVIEFLDPGEILVQAPGEEDFFYAEYVVGEADIEWITPTNPAIAPYWGVINTFEAIGYDSAADDIEAKTTANSRVLRPEISIEKLVDFDGDGIFTDSETNYAGEPAHWAIVVTNTGFDPVYDIYVSDDNIGVDFYGPFDLLANGDFEIIPVYTTYPVVDTLNTACAEGVDDLGNPVGPVCDPAEVLVLFEELTVEKTATAYFSRTHLWDIAKEVTTEFEHTIGGEETPKIWLVQNGTGDETATWNVCVTYLGYQDHDFMVFGEVTITNTGTADAVIMSVEDLLCGTAVFVDFGVTFPYTLPVGQTLVGTYSEDVDEAVQDCINEVTVTTERAQYSASADVIWGDPYVEHYDVVNIQDVSDLFGTVPLGMLYAASLSAGDVVCFDYDKFFAWADYSAPGPYTYDNTAYIVETGQNASARLIVNWTREELCWGDDTAWAFGGDDANPNWNYVNNRFWGWTNGPLPEGSYEWDIYAGAGQNILSKGTVVGTLYVEYSGDCVTVTYQTYAGYYMGETHLWVGYDPLPKVQRGRTGWVYTNSPGQFPYGTHKDPDFIFDPEDPSGTGLTVWTWDGCGFEGDIYVAAHSVVWMPVDCPEPDPIP